MVCHNELEFKTVEWKKHWLSTNKNKIPGAAVSKESHVDSVLGHKKTQSLEISLKK